MINYEDFLPLVLAEVPGCPDITATSRIRNAVRDFCEKTWVWQEVVPYETEQGEREIFVYIPRDSRLVAVRYLIKEGQSIAVPDELFIRAQRYPVEGEWEQEESKEKEARVILKPHEDSTSCPDFLYNDHSEAIAYGAKAKLMSMSTMPWYNPQLAMLNIQLFNKDIAQEKIKLVKGYAQKTLKVQMRRFV